MRDGSAERLWVEPNLAVALVKLANRPANRV
jgi:hypothetical protein